MQKTTIRLAGVALACALLLVLLPVGAAAKKKRNRGRFTPAPQWFQYSVSFTCGENAAETDRVAPGLYAVSVNVHNGGTRDATLRKHLALTFPPGGQVAGEVSDVIEEALAAGAAVQVSCEQLLGPDFLFLDPPTTPYVQGVLVLESSIGLDVTATHTATGATGEVSLDVERVPESRISFRRLSDQVEICHVPPGNPGNAHTIKVGADSWPAHQAHGDTLGPCP
jgi:hypothetical protein